MKRKELTQQLREAVKNRNYYSQRDIYFVNESTLGKKFKDKDNARHEFEIGKFAFDNGVQVPEPYELISPDLILRRLFDNYALKSWFILIERIKGVQINQINDEEIRKEALRQLETEIAKLFDLRIYPYGCVYPDKSLFDTTKKKLYLIDFEDWRKSPKDQPFDRNKSLKYDY